MMHSPLFWNEYLFVSSHDPNVEGIDEGRACYCPLSDKIRELLKGDEEAEDEEALGWSANSYTTYYSRARQTVTI